MLLQVFLVGWIVLVGAIIINVLAKKFHLKTWYDFLNKEPIRWYDGLFLFVVYPLLLGLLGYYGYNLLF